MPKQPLSCVSRPLVTGRLGTSLDGGSSMSSSFHKRGDRKAGEKASGALRSLRCPRPAIAAWVADAKSKGHAVGSWDLETGEKLKLYHPMLEKITVQE